ncbi:methyltransferase dimerization domain-containing protein [Lentibacillus sp. N15]|uniref:methyltransferase family protein n=1 Tax=Lentibacillus songyuanensis TaxID=3136161 RepID=UPI0031BAE715
MPIDVNQQQVIDQYTKVMPGADLLDMNFAFVRSKILSTAIELDIFGTINSGMDTPLKVAEKLKCDTDGIERLLEALLALGLLNKEKNNYSLSPISKVYLLEDGPSYIGGHLGAVMKQWDSWSNLTQAIQFGPAHKCNSQEIAPGLFPITFPVAWKLTDDINIGADSKILDINCGSGEWSIAFAIKNESSQVYSLDTIDKKSDVCKKAKEFGLDNLHFLHGNFENYDYPGEQYDVVIISHTIRFLGTKRSIKLLKKIYYTLKTNGRLIIVDAFSEPESFIPLLINLSMYLNTSSGRTYSSNELALILRDLGYSDTNIIKMVPYPVLVARR